MPLPQQASRRSSRISRGVKTTDKPQYPNHRSIAEWRLATHDRCGKGESVDTTDIGRSRMEPFREARLSVLGYRTLQREFEGLLQSLGLVLHVWAQCP